MRRVVYHQYQGDKRGEKVREVNMKAVTHLEAGRWARRHFGCSSMISSSQLAGAEQA